MPDEGQRKRFSLKSPLAIAASVALAKLLVYAYAGGSYGYFRDELYFLACADHLAFGYPDHAPLSVFVGEVSRAIFGDSLHAIRLFPALSGALRIVIAGLIVREFGGKHFATLIACLSVLAAPTYLALDNLMSMNSYESLFWMGCVLSFIWAVKRENPNYWLLFGAFAGLGLMNKHSMVFFGAAFAIALLFVPHRRVFAKPQFWMAGAIAFVVFLPNLVWQYQNDWATLELLRNVRESGKNVDVTPVSFILQQVLMLNPFTLPVWLGGLFYLLFGRNLREFRVLGITYAIIAVTMAALNAKNYYLAPVYPFLFAAGGVMLESAASRWRFGKAALGIYAFLIAGSGVMLAPLAVPILPVEKYNDYEKFIGVSPPKTEVAHEGLLPQHFGDMFGWEEMVEKTAEAYRALDPEERKKAAILAGNYGGAGAVDKFGARYGLPNAISPHQSYYMWGYGDFDGSVAVLLDVDKDDAEKYCEEVEVAGRVGGKYNMTYENFDILICRKIKMPLPEFWKEVKHWN